MRRDALPITHVAQLPDDVAGKIAGRDLIVFDGECVLCSGFFRFMVGRDRSARFSFALAQSDLGGALYDALDLPRDDFETNLVIVEGRIFRKMDAFAAAMGAVGCPWRAMSMLRFLPGFLKTPIYGLIARNRYRIFGRYETCILPDAALRSRFLD